MEPSGADTAAEYLLRRGEPALSFGESTAVAPEQIAVREREGRHCGLGCFQEFGVGHHIEREARNGLLQRNQVREITDDPDAS